MKIVFAYGRMNPPTQGHTKLVAAVQQEAAKNNADSAILLSHTEGDGKNPLSYQMKLYFTKAAFGEIVKDVPFRTVIECMKWFEARNYSDVVYVAGQDRVQEFQELLSKYNGHEYHFKSIKVVSAGHRDPDAEGIVGMSASKMRALATAGREAEFKAGAPQSLSFGDQIRLYHAVRKGLGLKEADYHSFTAWKTKAIKLGLKVWQPFLKQAYNSVSPIPGYWRADDTQTQKPRGEFSIRNNFGIIGEGVISPMYQLSKETAFQQIRLAL